MNADLLYKVNALHADYAAAIDEDRLEDWLELFTEDASYSIVSRENVAQGLPLALVSCQGRGMLEDRVVALRHANVYNLHLDRHIIGSIGIVDVTGDIASVKSNYALYQSDMDGNSYLFSVGCYEDELLITAERALIKSKRVIYDTIKIKNLLAYPI